MIKLKDKLIVLVTTLVVSVLSIGLLVGCSQPKQIEAKASDNFVGTWKAVSVHNAEGEEIYTQEQLEEWYSGGEGFAVSFDNDNTGQVKLAMLVPFTWEAISDNHVDISVDRSLFSTWYQVPDTFDVGFYDMPIYVNDNQIEWMLSGSSDSSALVVVCERESTTPTDFTSEPSDYHMNIIESDDVEVVAPEDIDVVVTK